MLNEYERLELIRQGERANISNEAMETLQEWAAGVRIECCLIDLLFDGHIELKEVNERGPSFNVTPKGQNFIAETEVEFTNYLESYNNPEDMDENIDDKIIDNMEVKELYIIVLKALLATKS